MYKYKEISQTNVFTLVTTKPYPVQIIIITPPLTLLQHLQKNSMTAAEQCQQMTGTGEAAEATLPTRMSSPLTLHY